MGRIHESQKVVKEEFIIIIICSLLMEEVVYFVGAESGVRSGQQSVHQCTLTLASLGTKLLFQLLSSQISAKYTYLPYSWPLYNYEIIPVLRTWFFLLRFISHKLITYITGIKKKQAFFGKNLFADQLSKNSFAFTHPTC